MNLQLSKNGNGQCIVCSKQIECCGPSGFNIYDIPGDAIVFRDCGNYGSAVNDSACYGHYLEILVCDECVIKHKEKIQEYQDLDNDNYTPTNLL